MAFRRTRVALRVTGRPPVAHATSSNLYESLQQQSSIMCSCMVPSRSTASHGMIDVARHALHERSQAHTQLGGGGEKKGEGKGLLPMRQPQGAQSMGLPSSPSISPTATIVPGVRSNQPTFDRTNMSPASRNGGRAFADASASKRAEHASASDSFHPFSPLHLSWTDYRSGSRSPPPANFLPTLLTWFRNLAFATAQSRKL